MANFRNNVAIFMILCILSFYCYTIESKECLKSTEFECGDGTCIRTEKICDGKFDCVNGDDEKDCGKVCSPPHWFLCSDNETCIAYDFRCDGTDTCPNGEDEDNCGSPHKHSKCSKFEFTCTDKSCIPMYMVCDGRQDCPDKSDETIGCVEIETKCKGFLCKNKHCLESHDWVCDGFDDCGDGSDEIGCSHSCTLENHKFLCKNNDTCIPLKKVCDNVKDCSDNSDEHDLCKDATQKCKDHVCPSPSECVVLSSGPKCYCPKGFYFNETRKRCFDINECETYGICSQGCNNTEGSYTCTCDEKYKLSNNNKTCQVKGGEALLLYSTQKTIVGIYLKSRHMYHVAVNLSQVIGVSYDGHSIYWTDIKHNEESIVKAREDGSDPEVIVTSGLEAPEDLAVDWLTGNVYFTDNLMKHIAVCSNTGTVCVSLVVEDVDQPRGIALYPKEGLMYWTDWGSKPMIGVASMNGEHARPFVNTKIHWPNGLVLDIPNDRLYWVDGKEGRIESILFNGQDRRVVIDGILKHPYGISIFEDTLYWSDWSTKSIHSCNKFSGKHHEVLTKDRTIYDIHIYHSALQPKSNHACLTHKCSHLCLLATNNTYSCACPEGMALNIDQLTCRKNPKKQRLYFGVSNFLVEMEHTAFGRHKAAQAIPLPMYIHRMEYNTLNGTIFIADNVQRVIYEFNPLTKTTEHIISSNIGNVSALSFDHLTSNLYWSDSERQTIEVISLTRRLRAIVSHFSGTDIPISMVVIPEVGKMFVALKSNSYVHIDIQALHGRGAHNHAFEDKFGTGNIQLYVDPDSETVFWVDTALKQIEFTDYDASFRHLFRSHLKRPVSMTLIDEDIMWSSHQSLQISWSHKSNLGSIKKFELDKPDYMNFPDDIPLLASKPLYVVDHKCHHNNGNCSHICVALGKKKSGCLCPPGLVFKDNNNMTCIDALDCEFRCRSGECLTSSRRCNGRKECADGSDEAECGSKTSAEAARKICSYDQFACHDGTQCVSNEGKCDKVSDCKDKSDEEDCEHFDHEKKCREHQHACDNGRCVDITTLCDGINDCGDLSDEKTCGKQEELKKLCGNNMFTCTSGQCVPKEWECDSHMDCVDGSDEHEKCAPTQCPEGSSRCKMGQCIDKALICDGHNDCGDNSDEIDCAIKAKYICEKDDEENPTMFQCPSDATKCFDIKVKCNGTAECPRGEDEVGCTGCSFYEFQCRSDKLCIRKEFRCDKQKDCLDGSDEMDCKYYNGTVAHQFATMCQDDMFDCSDGTCIEQLRVCDGVADCKNGQDESPVCKTACSSAVCEHKCTSSPYGAVCSCRNGFRLNEDKRTCRDIDECLETNPCAQTCENSEGSYRCGCYGGFLLRSDKTSCKSIEGDHFLLFTSFNQVRKLSENPYALKILWTEEDTRIMGMDVNIRNKKIYYTIQDAEAIYEYDLNSTTRKELSDSGKKEKLAVDWITENIYVVDYSGVYSIKVCNFNKFACSKIIRLTGRETVKTLAVDAINRFLFYAVVHFESFGNPESVIYKTGLDGSRKVMVASKPAYVTALVCDFYRRQIYFIDAHSKTLQSISYQGTTSKTIIRHENTITNPSGLTIFENFAFIINTGSPEAVKCKLYGDGSCKAFNLNVYNAEDIVIVAQSRQKKALNVCESNRCSHICVQAELGSKCLCQDGIIVKPDVQCSAELNNIIKDAVSTEENHPSHAVALTICLIMLAVILTSLCGYFYYQRHGGQRNFNINMHFQNPFTRSSAPNTSTSYRTETNQIKMPRPVQRLLHGGQVSEISMEEKEEVKFPFNGGPGNSGNAEDSDDATGRDVESYRDDPWSRLVK